MKTIFLTFILLSSSFLYSQDEKKIETAIYDLTVGEKNVYVYTFKSDDLSDPSFNYFNLINDLEDKEGFIYATTKDNYIVIYVQHFVEPESIEGIIMQHLVTYYFESHREATLKELKQLQKNKSGN